MSSTSRSTILALLALLALSLAILPSTAAEPAKQIAPAAPGARGGPRHDDVAAPWGWKLPPDLTPIGTVPLSAEVAKEILDASSHAANSPSHLQPLPSEDRAATARTEQRHLVKEGSAVRRKGGELVVRPRSGRPVAFRNRRVPATRNRDGDGTAYVYAGRVGAGGLHRIEARFEHDAPGSFLLSPITGRSLFVHEGSDDVALSPDGARLVVYNELNSPHTVVVASLAASGPNVELVCRSREKAAMEMKGWHGPNAVDLVRRVGNEATAARVPVRLERSESGWHVGASGPSASFSCFAGPFPEPLR